jgi:hypothetical protein
MRTSSVWGWFGYEGGTCGERLHESRMREIRTSGSTRGEGRGCCLARYLLYSTVEDFGFGLKLSDILARHPHRFAQHLHVADVIRQ